MVPPLTRTADGFELQFGTNHLGHFALTNLLLEHITGRVVTVSSTGHRIGEIDFDDLNWEHKPYQRLARLRAVQARQPAVHRRAPAPADGRRLAGARDRRAPRLRGDEPPVPQRAPSLDLISRIGNRLLAQDEDGGALPTLYAAVADVPGNSFAGPGGFMEQRGAPKLVGPLRRRQGRRRGAPAVGRLRGADRRAASRCPWSRPPRRRQPTPAGRRSGRPPPTTPAPSRAPRSTPAGRPRGRARPGSAPPAWGRRRRGLQPQSGERVVAVVLDLDDVGRDAPHRSREAAPRAARAAAARARGHRPARPAGGTDRDRAERAVRDPGGRGRAGRMLASPIASAVPSVGRVAIEVARLGRRAHAAVGQQRDLHRRAPAPRPGRG